MTFIVCGLGNFGSQYKDTRHNIGWDVVECFADYCGIAVSNRKCRAQVGEGYLGEHIVIIAEPLTYVNSSGQSVVELKEHYKSDNIIIVHDDIYLPVGKLRIKKKGGAGGHNGVSSVISALGTESFFRVKIGVGFPQTEDLKNYVLKKFLQSERLVFSRVAQTGKDAISQLIIYGIDVAMNKFN